MGEPRVTQIKVGEYILKIDSMCMWIEQVKKPKDNKKTDEYSTRVSGYCRNFEHLMRNFTEMKMKSIDAQTMAHFLVELRDIENQIVNLAAELGKSLDRRNG